MTDNQKLRHLFEADQYDRQHVDWETDWLRISLQDAKRREILLKMIDKEEIRTAHDYYHAALIFQHGSTIKEFKQANELASKAMQMELEEAKWLYAATTDRLLMNLGKKQKFGTQYIKITNLNTDGSLYEKWILYPYDRRTTDAVRQSYNVPTLRELMKDVPRN